MRCSIPDEGGNPQHGRPATRHLERVTIEALKKRIRVLELRDAELRAAGAGAIELEANRLNIVQLQWELVRRLLGPADTVVAA